MASTGIFSLQQLDGLYCNTIRMPIPHQPTVNGLSWAREKRLLCIHDTCSDLWHKIWTSLLMAQNQIVVVQVHLLLLEIVYADSLCTVLLLLACASPGKDLPDSSPLMVRLAQHHGLPVWFSQKSGWPCATGDEWCRCQVHALSLLRKQIADQIRRGNRFAWMKLWAGRRVWRGDLKWGRGSSDPCLRPGVNGFLCLCVCVSTTPDIIQCRSSGLHLQVAEDWKGLSDQLPTLKDIPCHFSGCRQSDGRWRHNLDLSVSSSALVLDKWSIICVCEHAAMLQSRWWILHRGLW